MRWLLLMAALLLPTWTHAQNYQALEAIYLDPAIAAHELDEHARALAQVIEASPATEEGWLALQRLMKLRGQLASTRELHALLRKLAQDDFRSCGRFADSFVDAYTEIARDHEPDAAWHAVSRRWAGITRGVWIGPFGEGSASMHDDMLPPEVTTEFGRTYPGAYGPVTWQPIPAVRALDGSIDLRAAQRWGGSGYFFAMQIVSGEEQQVVLKPEFYGAGRVWLNGAALADVDARARDYPQLQLQASLRRGRNLLLVKLSNLSWLKVRLRTPDGRPLSGTLAESPDAETKPSWPDRRPAPVAMIPGEVRALEASSPSDSRTRALRHLALATACDAHRMTEAASEHIEAAWAELRDHPVVALQFLSMVESSPLFSGAERRRLEAAILEGLLASEAPPVAALLRRAESMARDERLEEAVDLLDRAAVLGPGNWRVPKARADFFERVQWRAEWLHALQQANRLNPVAIAPLRALGQYWSWRGVPERQAFYDRQILEIAPAHRDALASLVSTLLRVGNTEEALKFARMQAALDPASDYAQGRLATALQAAGKLDDALAVYESMATFTGHPEEAWNMAAHACLEQGEEVKAAEYLRRVLAASPGEHTARRQLQRMTGESEDFWSAHALAWDKALEHDVNPADFPRADSALVLDESVQVMYPDGSCITYVHQVRKILTQDGVDLRGRETIRGELLTARTVRLDGSVLEPITYGANQLEFPGVAIGCYIDIAYLTRSEPNPWGTLMGDRFFFSDPELEEPFCISRWVLIAPSGRPLGVSLRNFAPEEYTGTNAGTNVIHTWDVRRPIHPEAEAFAPPPLAFIPWVEVTQPRDWRVRVREIGDRGLGMTRRVTGLVRERAREITEGLETDEAKARAIYAWVNANLTTQGDSINPHQSLKALAGDRQALFAALCAGAGLELGFAAADYAPVWRRAPEEDMAMPNWAYARDEDFDLFLFVIRTDAGLTYIDLTDRLRPFGALPARRASAPVLMWMGGRYALTQLPGDSAGTDRFNSRAEIRLKPDGSADLTGALEMRGERAWALKDRLRTQPQDELQDQLEGELADLFPGLDLDEFSLPGLNDADAPLVRAFAGKSPQMAQARGDVIRLALPLEKLGNLLSILVATKEREFPLVLDFELQQTDELRIHAPEGWRFRTLPQDLLYPTAPMMYSLQFRLDGDVLVVSRALALGPGRIAAAAYPALVEQVASLSRREDSVMELVRAGAGE